MRNESDILATRHYLDRAKERVGYNEKRATKLLSNAIDRGITEKQCKYSSDRCFLENRNSDNCKAIAYNGWCFIIDKNSNRCMTIVPLPKDFGRKKRYYEVKKMNDPRHLRRMAFAF